MVPDNIHIAHPDKLFIGGAWVESTADRMIEIVSPNSEAVIARVVDGTEADMDRAVAAARTAFDDGPWSTMAPAERGAIVRRNVRTTCSAVTGSPSGQVASSRRRKM